MNQPPFLDILLVFSFLFFINIVFFLKQHLLLNVSNLTSISIFAFIFFLDLEAQIWVFLD